jgi:hypothetical protein
MKRTSILVVFIVLGFLLSFSLKAQVITTDSSGIEEISTKQRFSPRKAALLSAALPGLGQAYNRKYWKVPIVYIGAATFGYVIRSHHNNYINYSDALRDRLAGNSAFRDPNDPFPNIGDDGLRRATDVYRRYRDLTVILSVMFYALNITDAMVDAHLAEFNVRDDVALKVQPAIIQTSGNTASAGLSLKLSIK